MFSMMFGLEYKEGNSSIFAGGIVEVMKNPFLGKNGHIAISTNYIERAIACMQSHGFELDTDSAKKDAGGKLAAVYFKQEIGGFAIHLVQKKGEAEK